MIEAGTFEAMMAGFEALAVKVEAFCERNEDKHTRKWLDIQEVCEILKISKRHYRHIEISQIGHKTYYRPQDVERVISNLKQKSNE